MSSDSLLDLVPVIPVVVVHDAADAVPIAKALVDGGLPVIELTLRTPAALEAIKRIADEVPEILVGAGTVVDTAQPQQAAANGAQFLVSPGSTPALRTAMRDSGLPHLPGVSTVSEVLTLLEEGYTELKFFPAEPAGGAAYLRAIHSPVPAARFCPTGGITPANMGDYLASPNVGCVGGSWLTPADVVARQDWAAVAELARTARSAAVQGGQTSPLR
ncbi:bifunctional 4-hydroxy-2-oxoglutarate aldolase/2-dehydro-3-deoxy-phosphogluconate aldolase [Mycolicibacterium goodii]|uniref:2-dehydro-3-deoxy-phosphogluconate aldolase n=1 Tax=Mycolicibacterium goodii TaxID=134601 RepID=A0A0K0X3F6_MYCGD|nr:keto-deoxy-phosphogluconate aldolase [Mycolicibacterium goodii]